MMDMIPIDLDDPTIGTLHACIASRGRVATLCAGQGEREGHYLVTLGDPMRENVGQWFRDGDAARDAYENHVAELEREQ